MRRFSLMAFAALAFAFLVVPFMAFAQEAAPVAAASPFAGLLAWLFSPAGFSTAITVALGALGLVLGNNEVRRRRVAKAFHHGFLIVEDIDSEFEPGDTGSKLDKVVAGLRAADEWMVANGWRPLTAEEQAVAKLGFKALNGQSEAAVAAQAKVAALAKTGGASPLVGPG